jgi:hypothetical protein
MFYTKHKDLIGLTFNSSGIWYPCRLVATDVSEQLDASIFTVQAVNALFLNCLHPNMEVASCSETSVTINQSTRRLHQHHCENLKSCCKRLPPSRCKLACIHLPRVRYATLLLTIDLHRVCVSLSFSVTMLWISLTDHAYLWHPPPSPQQHICLTSRSTIKHRLAVQSVFRTGGRC